MLPRDFCFVIFLAGGIPLGRVFVVLYRIQICIDISLFVSKLLSVMVAKILCASRHEENRGTGVLQIRKGINRDCTVSEDSIIHSQYQFDKECQYNVGG